MVFSGAYPGDWPTIAFLVKNKAGWRCERCGHEHDVASGHVLTVHHLDGNKSNNELWNLAALCQRCHLSIQSRVEMRQVWMFEHSEWMKPHVEEMERALRGADHSLSLRGAGGDEAISKEAK